MTQGQLSPAPRLSDPELADLMAALWQGDAADNQNWYAVLDGAQDKRIEPWLNNSGLPHDCLIANVKSYATRRAAPHVVQLRADHPLTQTLLREGWAKHWGILLRAPRRVTLAQIRLNLKKNTYVRAPNGRRMIFRFYDPRVLRQILPLLGHQQLGQLFGDATALVLDAPDCRLHEYALTADGQLRHSQQQILLDDVAALPSPKITAPAEEDGLRTFGEFAFTAVQMKALEKAAWLEVYKDVCATYCEDYALDPAGQIDFFARCLLEIEAFALTTRVSMTRYLSIARKHGPKFYDAPGYRWAKELLMSPRQADFRMADIDNCLSEELMERLWR